MLEVRCEDIHQTLAEQNASYDIVVVNAFLHHVPEYLGLIRELAAVIKPGGQFFSFQDPLRYDTRGVLSHTFARAAYLSWRPFDGDVIGGLKRRFRRSQGIYLEESMHDNTEYHVTRKGVDQQAIRELLADLGFDCEIAPYFSTQSLVFQGLDAIGVKNTFGVIAQKRA